ncbi:chemotaxis protein CheA [Devosia sp. MC521]|uniref:chemotaxis protein CheA n=1 Tax=Devosia sp. MC521 TaxID=2759954 RepID=UPI0015F83560|nr:chemotaxis protein CheA [Devosia sp. MC521]MBJ6987749.1 chemotaxis protein CheA [Devosia sp. MC521]QMW62422.1 chemotaxis protein CheA [Devosia sp. MC521]
MIGIDPAETFRQEARDLLEELESGLLDLGQDPQNRALIDSSFRALHTIKGSGAMFGFTAVANFVHEFETAFDRVRKGQSDASSRLIDIALEAKDYISALIEDEETYVDGDAILSRLRVIVGSSATAPAADVAPAAPSVAPDGIKSWRLEFYLPSDALVFGTNPQLLLAELADIGPTKVMALTERVPALDTLDPEVPHIGWRVDIDAVDPSGAIDDVFMFLRDAMELTLVEVAPEAAPAPVSGPSEPAPSSVSKVAASAKADATGDKAASTSLRVPAERLDELMDRVGELVIAQARLSQLAAHSDDATLKSVAEDLERLSSGLRDTTMGIRMVPIGTLFSRFRRLVYDLSSELGKPIEFVTAGEDTELDKNVIERLADPLVHLIRNAVDHGLESPDRRRASGKSETGIVRLSATYSGAEVAISVTDDGAGLDAQRIRAKAEENGLISADAKLSDQELYQLIFAPGFSTAQQVTSLSGRGVGMDVVKRTIDGLRGTIELNTNPGAGTTASLRLPLTLAIIEGMLVRVGDGLYTIPLAAVEECVELTAEAEATRSGRNFLDIRGSLVPYLRLREVFQTPGVTGEHQKVVIVSSGEGRVGLVVDQIIGNNQTVIKQLSRLHSGIRTFSGATILGDGSVALILDTAHLVSAGQSYVGRSERAAS